jgi:hypothetical protein
VETIKCLAWHLIHACEDICIYEQLASVQANDRKKIIRLIDWCLQNGRQIKTELTQDHLNDITELLLYGDYEQVAEIHFDLAMYVFAFGMARIRAQLEKLDDQY